MSDDSFHPTSELAHLVSLHLDGSLDSASHRRMQQILLADDAACEWFNNVMLVHSLLYLDGNHETLELPPNILANSLTIPIYLEDASHPLQTGIDSPATDYFQTPHGKSSSPRSARGSRRWRRLVVTIAASVLAIAGIVSVTRLAGHQKPYRGKEVAKVRSTVGARFAYGSEGESRPVAGNSLRQGRYELLDGLLEIEYDTGASLVIMSPAEFRLADETSVELSDGKLSAEIPEAAVGFKVDTVGGSVVDLGTAFGVEARRGESADVHVFEGEVRVEAGTAEGQEMVPLQLLAGHASRINPFSAIPSGIDMNRLEFVRQLGATKSSYADAVMALQPVVYYRMEPVGDGTWLEDSSPSGAHAKIYTTATGGSPWTGGRVGAAFALGGPSEQTFAIANDYPKAHGNQLSVVCWVYAESRPFWASIAKNWGNPVVRGQFHFGLLSFSGELAAHIFDVANPHDEEGCLQDVCAQDSVPLPLFQWHHVAMVADGSMLRLYRNGEQVDEVPYQTLHLEPSLQALAIGTKLKDSGESPADMPNRSMWDGRLDELAVFNHALTPEDIRHLYRLSCDASEASTAMASTTASAVHDE